MIASHTKATWKRIWYSDPIAIEKFSSIALWGWAIVLALPWNTLDSSTAFTAMKGLCVHENVWAAWFGLAALLQTISTCFFVRWLRYPSAILAMLVWVFTSSMLGIANIRGTGWMIYGLLAASQAWVVLRGPR